MCHFTAISHMRVRILENSFLISKPKYMFLVLKRTEEKIAGRKHSAREHLIICLLQESGLLHHTLGRFIWCCMRYVASRFCNPQREKHLGVFNHLTHAIINTRTHAHTNTPWLYRVSRIFNVLFQSVQCTYLGLSSCKRI